MRERGFTLVEILIVVTVLLLLLGWAAPRYAAARVSANEAAAIRNLRTLHEAQAQYYAEFGRHARSLEELGAPKGTLPGPTGAGLIAGDLARGEKHGYRFEIRETKTGYELRAKPLLVGITGRRTFVSNETLGLYQSETEETPDAPEAEEATAEPQGRSLERRPRP
jgi:prepilin-type N-terminal cleavage/methylation domain-containing protein